MIDYASHYLNGAARGTGTVVLEEKRRDGDYDRDLENNSTLPCPSWDLVRSHLGHLTPASVRHLTGRLLFALLPSFIQSPLLGEHSKKQDRLAPTAYLDGIRGLAAFFVFICHFTYNCFVITYGYGQGDEHENDYFLQLPIIRLIYSGPPMVCVFFVVSGYALSLKPLKLMRSRQWDKLHNTMASSIFRRGMRLFLPTSISMLIVAIMLWLGIYEMTRDFAENSELLWHVREPHPVRQNTLYEQLWDWSYNVCRFVSVWSWDSYAGSTTYDVHLWTIPVEFRSSLCLFAILTGLSRCRCFIRLTVLSMLTYWVLRCDRWEVFLFLSGAGLAELDLIRQSQASSNPVPASSNSSRGQTTRQKSIWIGISLIGLYLMSQPDEYAEETPGWVWLSAYIPEWFSVKYRFWQCIGSVVFVWAVNSSPPLQAPFTTSFSQYLGKLSYAIYLMHGPVIHIVGYAVEPRAWAMTGYTTYEAYVMGFILSSLVVVPSLFWAADVFWRAFDTPSVKFARWMENKCAVPAE